MFKPDQKVYLQRGKAQPELVTYVREREAPLGKALFGHQPDRLGTYGSPVPAAVIRHPDGREEVVPKQDLEAAE